MISVSESGLVYCRISGKGSYIICSDNDKFIYFFENRNGIYKKVQEIGYSSTSGQARAEISKIYDYAFIRLSSKNYIYKFKADVCGFTGCRACRNPDECRECETGYYLNSENYCCSDGCLDCNATHCLQCN